MKINKIFAALVLFGLSVKCSYSQELGLNFNHNPENIDFKYVEKINPKWIRATPRILDYVDGLLNPDTDTATQKLVDAGKQGYRIAFGFRWDFKDRNLAMPEPGSERELSYFQVVDRILERVGLYVDIFTLGNEPNLESIESDLQYSEGNKVPLVIFTEQQLNHVKAFYKKHPDWKMPQFYTGSLPALFEKKQQDKPGVYELIKFTQQRDDIEGLAIHLHIRDTLQIEQSFDFVRNIMPEKTIIVPEFSLFRLYNRHFGDKIGASLKGQEFAKKHQLSPDLKIHEWLTLVHAGKAPYQQWEEFFLSQDWYIPGYLKTYYRYFKKYNVALATYPLLQQGFAKVVTEKSVSWFLNPLFLQKSFGLNEKGEYYVNPLSFPDYTELMKNNKN